MNHFKSSFFRGILNLKMIATTLLTNISQKIYKISYTWTIDKYSLFMEYNSPKGLTTDEILSDGKEQCFIIKLGSSNLDDLSYMNVCLSPVDNGKFKTNGKFSIKMKDCSAKESNFTTDMNNVKISLIEWKQLFKQSKSFLPNDKLILSFEIDWEEKQFINFEHVNSIKVPACNLTEDLGALFETKEFADVTIVTADDHKIPAHKTILSARSKVFAAMFRHSTKEKAENCVDINDFSSDVIIELLRFMYTGKAPKIIMYNSKMTFDLLTAADKYQLDTLKAMCARSLSINLSIDTAPIVLKAADLYNMEDLKSKAIRFIKSNIHKIRETNNWKELIKTNRKLVIATFIKEKLQEFNLNDTLSSEDED